MSNIDDVVAVAKAGEREKIARWLEEIGCNQVFWAPYGILARASHNDFKFLSMLATEIRRGAGNDG